MLSPYIDSTLAIGIWVLGIHYTTYMAEVYRAGIDSVPTGQWEAATALSLPRVRTWRAVVVPQAIRNTLPALGNYAISMFKETPFFVVIYIPELVRAAQGYGDQFFRYTEPDHHRRPDTSWPPATPTSLLIRRLEKKLA